MKTILGVTWLGAALLVGCGGDGPDVEEDPPVASCDITLSGAMTGTPECRDVSLIYFTESDDFSFTLETASGSRPFVLVRPSANGRPAAEAFTGPSTTVDCGVSVRDGAKAWYAYLEDSRSGVSLIGSCTLTFTQAEVYAAVGNTTSYRFQGTLQAHLLAMESTGATGTVDVQVNFSY
ncbi:hypothetical protein ACLESO_37245 [Pyxidicoccus sp. 3LG]